MEPRARYVQPMADVQVSEARPYLVRAGLAGLAALAGSVLASFGQLKDKGRPRGPEFDPATGTEQAFFLVGVALVLIGGVLAARFLGKAIGRATAGGLEAEPAGTPLARLVTITGYVIVVLWVLSTFGIPLDVLLLGGALSGIILGIAAQQTLGNIFAGIVLLIVRPFRVGEHAIIKSTLGEYEGLVTNMGFFYVKIQTKRGRVELPNAVALASAVGPGVRSPSDEASAPADEEEEEAEATSAHGPVDRADRPEAL
ncbi:MAG: mechanosensitive ion channel [Actinobacteria bacterium]|nr:mechanosensitive ion channel [Actinomycetota bacterium]